MNPKETRLFFAESIDEPEFVDHCTRVLFARVADRERLHVVWTADDGRVWARDVRRTLAGQLLAPVGVAESLGVIPVSGLAFTLDDQPASEYIGFLVVTALLGRWRGCVIPAGDPTVIAPKDMRNPASVERLLQVFCEPWSRDE